MVLFLSTYFWSFLLFSLIFPGAGFSFAKLSSFLGVTFFILSRCSSVKSLLAGFVFSALSGDLICCSLLKWRGESCFDVFGESAFCVFLFLGVEFAFLGALFVVLFPILLLELSFTWFLLKQLARINGVGLHLNSSVFESSLHGNSSTRSWSTYRSFRFGKLAPSHPLYETLLRNTLSFLRRRSSKFAKKRWLKVSLIS